MIDYDGIGYDFCREIDIADKMLFSGIIAAMEDGEITRCNISFEWEICDTCRGDGGHSHRFGAITAENRWEWDEDDFGYYTSGAYDENCDRCDGSGKVKTISLDDLPQDVRDWINDYLKYAYESAEDRRAERLAGC